MQKKQKTVPGRPTGSGAVAAFERRGGEYVNEARTVGWQPTCACGELETIPCTVLDPFAGLGTVGRVALSLGRRAILIELQPKYLKLIRERCQVAPGLALA